jgi:hypothetical protein
MVRRATPTAAKRSPNVEASVPPVVGSAPGQAARVAVSSAATAERSMSVPDGAVDGSLVAERPG